MPYLDEGFFLLSSLGCAPCFPLGKEFYLSPPQVLLPWPQVGGFSRYLYYFCFLSICQEFLGLLSSLYLLYPVLPIALWWFLYNTYSLFFFFGTVKYTIFSCVNWYYMHILISTFSSSVQIPGNDFCLCQEETQWGRRNELSQVVL